MTKIIKVSLVLLSSSILAMLGSCAYTETMADRDVERQGLQTELGNEMDETRRLTR